MELTNYYNISLPDEVLVSFRGEGSEEKFASVLEESDEALHGLKMRSKIRKKLYHIVVEALQNMHHHAEETHHPESAMFILGKEDEDYWIITGNYVRIDEVEKLKDHLAQVNATSPEDLKRLYRERLACGDVSEKGGAGLGIIDIARRSGNPLSYEFAPAQGEYVFFYLKIKVSA